MENVTSWALSVCGAALGCSAVLMLAPQGGLGKLLRLLVTAVLVLNIASPIGNLVRENGDQWKTSSDILPDTALTDTVQDQLCKRVEQAVYDACTERYGDAVEKVEAVTDISENDGIYMKHIRVYIRRQASAKASAVKGYVEQQTGLPVEMELYDE